MKHPEAVPPPSVPHWEHFSHDADVGICGYGNSLAESFEQAALALTAVVTDANVMPSQRVDVHCAAPDVELLFVDWLNAVIFQMAVRQMLFGRFSVHIEDHTLRGELWGETIDPARHAPACEPKGATYTALSVEEGPDGVWRAGCVVDV